MADKDELKAAERASKEGMKLVERVNKERVNLHELTLDELIEHDTAIVMAGPLAQMAKRDFLGTYRAAREQVTLMYEQSAPDLFPTEEGERQKEVEAQKNKPPSPTVEQNLQVITDPEGAMERAMAGTPEEKRRPFVTRAKLEVAATGQQLSLAASEVAKSMAGGLTQAQEAGRAVAGPVVEAGTIARHVKNLPGEVGALMTAALLHRVGVATDEEYETARGVVARSVGAITGESGEARRRQEPTLAPTVKRDLRREIESLPTAAERRAAVPLLGLRRPPE